MVKVVMVPDAGMGLVNRLRNRDESAFEELVRTQGPRMLATARRLLRTEEDARDAVQDAFLSSFRGIGAFDGQSTLSTWLHRIVINAALMKLRTARRRPELKMDDLLPQFAEDGHHADRALAWPAEQETRLARIELQARVRACIESLPESYRTVLVLRDIEELTTEEAAAALGVSEGAVKLRLHRARQALRTLLDHEVRLAAPQLLARTQPARAFASVA